MQFGNVLFPCVCIRVRARSVMSDSLRPPDCTSPGFSVHGIFPGENTGVGQHFLIQGIFLTQGLKPRLLRLLHWQTDSLPTVPPRKPLFP